MFHTKTHFVDHRILESKKYRLHPHSRIKSHNNCWFILFRIFRQSHSHSWGITIGNNIKSLPPCRPTVLINTFWKPSSTINYMQKFFYLSLSSTFSSLFLEVRPSGRTCLVTLHRQIFGFTSLNRKNKKEEKENEIAICVPEGGH